MQGLRDCRELPLQTQQKQSELSDDNLQVASSDEPTADKMFLRYS